MIRSFGSRETERLWRRERVALIDPRIQRVALRKLRQVGAADSESHRRSDRRATEFWLNLQTQFDLDLAEDRVADQIAAITPLRVA